MSRAAILFVSLLLLAGCNLVPDPAPSELLPPFTEPVGQPGAVAGVPVVVFEPAGTPRGTIVYSHGGGFTGGEPGALSDAAAAAVSLEGWRLVSVDYRLAPAHPFPAGLQDTVAVAAAEIAKGGTVVLWGESAGGSIAYLTGFWVEADAVVVQAGIWDCTGTGSSWCSKWGRNVPSLTDVPIAEPVWSAHGTDDGLVSYDGAWLAWVNTHKGEFDSIEGGNHLTSPAMNWRALNDWLAEV